MLIIALLGVFQWSIAENRKMRMVWIGYTAGASSVFISHHDSFLSLTFCDCNSDFQLANKSKVGSVYSRSTGCRWYFHQ